MNGSQIQSTFAQVYQVPSVTSTVFLRTARNNYNINISSLKGRKYKNQQVCLYPTLANFFLGFLISIKLF